MDDVVHIEEAQTIRMCRRLAKGGFLFGGSTGTVVSGAVDWLQRNDADDLTAVAISPDLGERYLETIYADEWVEENYGSALTTRFQPAWLQSTATAAGA